MVVVHMCSFPKDELHELKLLKKSFLMHNPLEVEWWV